MEITLEHAKFLHAHAAEAVVSAASNLEFTRKRLEPFLKDGAAVPLDFLIEINDQLAAIDRAVCTARRLEVLLDSDR